MKKINTSEVAFYSKQLLLAFCTPEIFNESQEQIKDFEEYINVLKEYDESIADCHGMFLWYKEEHNTEEMAYWRKMEQEAKTAKRLMMKKYMLKEKTAI